MRWIFFALVFANLLLLALFWQQQAGTQPAVTSLEVPDNSKRIALVTELEQPLTEVVVSADTNTVRNPMCYVAGPYGDELDAKHLMARASALGLDGKLKPVDIATDQPSEYWVHVPPRATRAEALRILKELQKRKVDSYIITQGELAEGVSLGLFRNKSSASGLRKKVESFDIPAEIKIMHKSKREYWIEIAQVSQLNEKMRERIRAGDDGVSWQLVVCGDSVAGQLSEISR